MSPLTPAYDNKIARKYSVGTINHKVDNKIALQEDIGWPAEANVPVICLPAGMTDELGGKLLLETLPGIMSLNAELLILGKGSKEYGSLFSDLAKDKDHKVHIVAESDEGVRQMYAAADMALFCTDPAGLPELEHCLQYGAVPIAPSTKALKTYNPVQESGNSFLYEQLNHWHCFAAVVRAVETHKFPFDWRTIQKNCMESVKE